MRAALALAFLAGVALPPLNAEEPLALSYYHLRIEYTTTSDWATLEWVNPGDFLTTRFVAAINQPSRADARPEQLALNQPIGDARAGKTVGMTVDAAAQASARERPINVRARKGCLGVSTIRVFLKTENELKILQEIKHLSPDDVCDRAVDLWLDLGGLRAIPPLAARIPLAPQKMLWAFYYPWYSASAWSSAQLSDRPARPYQSDDRDAIRRHIREAQAAGIDGFISSWWGPDSYTDRNLALLLEAAREDDFWVTIYFETLADVGRARGEDEIQRWLAYAISTYRDHPRFFKIGGKPLVVVWASEAVPLTSWKIIFDSLRARGLDAFYLAMSSDLGNLAVFDGLHQYGPAPNEPLASIAGAVRYYPLLEGTVSTRVWAPSVGPGYDDQLLDRKQHSYTPRQDGAQYRLTFDAAIRGNPDWIFICTWNEWWEHTYIEPSELYGDQYLRLTRQYAERWKGKSIRKVANAADLRAGAVAPGEMVTLFGLGLGPETPATAQPDRAGRLPGAVAGARVLFDGSPAPMLYAQASQVGAIVPYAVAGQTSTRVQVEFEQVKTGEVALPVAAVAPGIFTADASGEGQAAVLNEDGRANSLLHGAAKGSAVVFYATGEGQTNPPGVDGQIADAALPKPVQPVSVTIGERPAEVLYAGAAPGLVAGLMQVNARIPEDAPAGLAVPLRLRVGSAASRDGVTMAVGAALEGEFEAADGAGCRVQGWVRNTAAAVSLDVAAYRDGAMGSGIPAGAAAANLRRPDLPFDDKNHGFQLRFSGGSGLYEDREHAIFVYALDGRGAPLVALSGSPQTIRCGANGARFVSQSVPATMKAGAQYEISISMRNAGSRTWLRSPQGYHRLGSQSPQDNRTWGVGRIELPRDVAPGETVTITAAITAPSQPGAYGFQWRMVEDAVEWFGDASELVKIVVEGP